jgi:hypothetical protein
MSASTAAPEASRMAVKLAASIVVSRSATRHNSEFAAKASIASVVIRIRRGIPSGGPITLRGELPRVTNNA